MTTIQTKRSTTTTSVPADSTLALGELAVNITDKKVWIGGLTAAPVLLVDYALFASGGVTYFEGSGINISTEDVISLDLSTASFSSANLANALTDETGSGSAVFATSPTLVTPNLGTPSTLVGTNITGTASGFTAGAVTNAGLTGEVTTSGLSATLSNSAVIGKVLTGYTSGAGVVAATDTILQAIQKLNGNAGGGPAAAGTLTGDTLAAGVVTSSLTTVGTLANLTVTNPISGSITGNAATATTAGTVTTNANLTGHITSTGNATALGSFTSLELKTALTDETGTGAAVFATSPTLVTPALGAATGTTLVLSGNITAPNVVYDVNGLVGPIDVVAGAGMDVVVTTNNSIIITAAPNTTTQTVDFSEHINRVGFTLVGLGADLSTNFKDRNGQEDVIIGTNVSIDVGAGYYLGTGSVTGKIYSASFYLSNSATNEWSADLVIKQPLVFNGATSVTAETLMDNDTVSLTISYYSDLWEEPNIINDTLVHQEETYVTKTVTGQSWVTTDSYIICKVLGGITVDHDAEDAIIEGVRFEINNIVNGVGFDLIGHAPEGTYGKYSVKCIGQ